MRFRNFTGRKLLFVKVDRLFEAGQARISS